MELYIDEIRGAQKLEPIGYILWDDDDHAFYAIHGLLSISMSRVLSMSKEIYCLMKLATILSRTEESLLHKDEGITSSKVLLATQKMPQNVVQEQALSFHKAVNLLLKHIIMLCLVHLLLILTHQSTRLQIPQDHFIPAIL